MNIYAIVKRKRKKRRGRGFSRNELQSVGLSLTEASKFGLPIDLKRTSNHVENRQTLTTWLKETQSQLESTKGSLKPVELRAVKGIGPKTAKKLEEAGIETANDLVSKNPQQVANILGTSEKMASNLLKNARSLTEKT
jgi:hypothetical protein